jgi:hypothetical protein
MACVARARQLVKRISTVIMHSLLTCQAKKEASLRSR